MNISCSSYIDTPLVAIFVISLSTATNKPQLTTEATCTEFYNRKFRTQKSFKYIEEVLWSKNITAPNCYNRRTLRGIDTSGNIQYDQFRRECLPPELVGNAGDNKHDTVNRMDTISTSPREPCK